MHTALVRVFVQLLTVLVEWIVGIFLRLALLQRRLALSLVAAFVLQLALNLVFPEVQRVVLYWRVIKVLKTRLNVVLRSTKVVVVPSPIVVVVLLAKQLVGVFALCSIICLFHFLSHYLENVESSILVGRLLLRLLWLHVVLGLVPRFIEHWVGIASEALLCLFKVPRRAV